MKNTRTRADVSSDLRYMNLLLTDMQTQNRGLVKACFDGHKEDLTIANILEIVKILEMELVAILDKDAA